MREEWSRAIITHVALAMHVEGGAGKSTHVDRPFQGLVINEEGAIKEYVFSDGRVMRTEGGELFYLPKGSSYYVRDIVIGGCYAVNFEADIGGDPFSVDPMDGGALQKLFREAAAEWKTGDSSAHASTMKALYAAIGLLQKKKHTYQPNARYEMIREAVETVERELTDRSLSVERLAMLCGMSEVYFRKLFISFFGVSPKEYIIQKRIEYAKSLLRSGDFSVCEVAELCGYSEPCHFSREFSRRTGVPPSRYFEK